jgi:hypothetical protein
MSLKRECDRCHDLALVDSISGREYRLVQISQGGTASTNGGATTLFKTFDVCRGCAEALSVWLKRSPVEAATA